MFLAMTKRALARHGLDLTYSSVVTGAYSVETGKPTRTKTEYILRLYPKQFVANQYNYPTLVGKESILFYLANDALNFVPNIDDEISYKGKVYKVQSIQEHVAQGTIALYKLVAVRG